MKEFKIEYVTKAGVTGVIYTEAVSMQAAFEQFMNMKLKCTMLTIKELNQK